MTTIDPLVIRLQADVNDLKVGLAQATTALKGVDDNVKTASTGMTNFIGKLKQVGATMGIAFAGQQVVQFGKDILMAASDMNESLSKVQVVFGENADAITRWSETSSTAMGLSKQGALEAAGTYGNLFQAFGLGQGEATKMSTSLVQLASDMASFNNTSVDDALLALRSGLSGETEPLKRFGVALNDVRLKEEAMRMGLIKTTSGTLPPAIKAQAAYALIMHDTTLAQGDFERTSSGTANTMRIVAAQMQNAKAALGEALLPAFQALLLVLKPIIAGLAAFGKFMAENKEVVATFATVIGVASAAWGVYTLVTKRAAIQQAILNGIMAINPIGALVVAIAALSAGIVYAWKHSEGFRKTVIDLGKAGVTAISFIIRTVGDLVTGMMKLVTGPMRLLLKGLSLLGVKEAGNALKEINGIIDSTGNFFDSAAKKVEGLTAKLDEMGKKKTEVDKVTKSTKDAVKETTDKVTDTKISAADQKKLEGYQKDVIGIYKDMNDAITEANEKAQKELEQYNEKKLEAHKKYDERYAELYKVANEAKAEAQKRFDESTVAIEKRRKEDDAKAQKRHDEDLLAIKKDYNKRAEQLEKDHTAKLADIRQKAADKSAELTKSANEKQIAIIQQSMDRLRNAFASKTGFSISEAFASGADTADKLIDDLKNKLAGAKKLQENAAALAGLGYSQVFIEEVVKNGPEAGNKIAEALKTASPEATKQLQSLYNQVGNISDHGLDNLAKTMNAGGKLATEELMTSFNQVGKDLKEALSVVNNEMNASLADANASYADAMAEAKATRDEKLADAEKTLTEALAESKKNFDEANAEALKTLTESRQAAQKALDEGLADAQKELADALAKAQKDYENAIDEINKATQKKLDDLKLKLKEVADQMAALGAKQQALQAMQNAPVYTPISTVTTPYKAPVTVSPGVTVIPSAGATEEVINAAAAAAAKVVGQNNITVNGTNLADPDGTAQAIMSIVKYGQTVQVATSLKSGINYTGIQAYKSGIIGSIAV